MPELIRQGRVLSAVGPLYKVIYNNTHEYAMDDRGRDEILKKIKNKYKYTVLRYKGLGELNPKDLKETMVSPNTRTLMQYTMEDETMVNEVFSKLMGNDSTPRKRFLESDEL